MVRVRFIVCRELKIDGTDNHEAQWIFDNGFDVLLPFRPCRYDSITLSEILDESHFTNEAVKKEIMEMTENVITSLLIKKDEDNGEFYLEALLDEEDDDDLHLVHLPNN
jgi:hypothetical protein